MMKTHDKVYIERLIELSRLAKVEMQWNSKVYMDNTYTKYAD